MDHTVPNRLHQKYSQTIPFPNSSNLERIPDLSVFFASARYMVVKITHSSSEVVL
jgi:hypothetical protein